MNQHVLVGSVSAVRVVLPKDLPPTSVTYTVSNPDRSVLVTTTSLTHPSYTVTSAAARGREIVTSYGSNRVPQPGDELFLAASSNPHQSPVETVVVDRVSGTTIYTRESLRSTWASGSVLVPKTAMVPLSTVATATAGRCFMVTVNLAYSYLQSYEQADTVTTQFDVVANIPRCTVTVADIQRMYPSSFGRLAGTAQRESGGWEELRDRAFESVLEDFNRTIPAHVVYSNDAFVRPVIAKMLLFRAQDGTLYSDSVDRLSIASYQQTQYDRALQESLSSITWADTNENGVPDEGEMSVSLIPRISLVT